MNFRHGFQKITQTSGLFGMEYIQCTDRVSVRLGQTQRESGECVERCGSWPVIGPAGAGPAGKRRVREALR